MGEYKKPQTESPASVKAYLDGQSNYDGLYVVTSDSLLKYFFDSVGASIPNVYIFNKSRQNIYQDKSCVWANINQLDSLQNSESWKVTGLKMERLAKAITLVDGKTPGSGHDFIVYYVWAKFIPKLSKKMIAAMEKDFREKKQNVYIGNVNLDMQQ